MNRVPKIAALALALALAACNREPEVSATNASVEEVAEKVSKAGAGDSFVRPGLWESKLTIEQMDMPGMPADMAGQMKAMIAERQPKAFTSCLTPDDVKRPKEDFFAGHGKNCRYDRFAMGGGKIDAVMRCAGAGEAGSAGQVMEMSGTYSPDSYQMRMSNKVEVAGGGAEGAMAMRMRIDARRVGECPAKQG